LIEAIARGLGLKAMYDPAPGPGVYGSLSGGNGIDLGTIELVPSMGARRYATFREIYLTNPWVWAAVNVQARGVGRTPTGVFAIDEDGNYVRQRGDVPQPQGRPTRARRSTSCSRTRRPASAAAPCSAASRATR
jgi:hypothetical protein